MCRKAKIGEYICGSERMFFIIDIGPSYGESRKRVKSCVVINTFIL